MSTPKSHCTLLFAKDDAGVVVWMKSYDYEKERDQCQSDLKRLIEAGYTWELASMETLKIGRAEL